jgi:hypothetical protein
MKVKLDIKDNKAEFVLELLRNFSFVKTEPIPTKKVALVGDLKEAVKEVKLATEGKIRLQSAKDFLEEL